MDEYEVDKDYSVWHEFGPVKESGILAVSVRHGSVAMQSSVVEACAGYTRNATALIPISGVPDALKQHSLLLKEP